LRAVLSKAREEKRETCLSPRWSQRWNIAMPQPTPAESALLTKREIKEFGALLRIRGRVERRWERDTSDHKRSGNDARCACFPRHTSTGSDSVRLSGRGRHVGRLPGRIS